MKYAEQEERSACGISARIYLDRKPDHDMIQEGLRALDCADSRGGMGIDGTGDGSGIQLDLPTKLLSNELGLIVQDGQYGIGHIFLRSGEHEHAIRLIDSTCEAAGLRILAWRNTPYHDEGLSARAKAVMPELRQVIFAPHGAAISSFDLERKILAVHQQIINTAAADAIPLDIASLSCDHIIYKGMLRASQIRQFYPDLSDRHYVSKKFMTHVRFSTNTGSNWANAQPFGLSANGEFNTLGSNNEDRKAYAKALWGETLLMKGGWSDTRLFERDVAALRQRENLTIEEAIRRLMPPVIHDDNHSYSDPVKAMVQWFCQQRKSYDGPAHVVFDGDGKFGAIRDGSGLRPSCAVLFTNLHGRKIFYVGSEDRITDNDGDIIQRFSPQRGEMICIDYASGEAVLKRDQQILEELAAKSDYSAKVSAHAQRSPAHTSPSYAAEIYPLPLLTRQALCYWDTDSLSKTAIMWETGKQHVMSMGDDSTPPMLSGRPHRIADFFRQRFVQVTAPAQDFIREENSASMRIWLGRHPGIGNTRQNIIDSPILLYGQLAPIESAHKTARLEMIFPHRKGALKDALRRLCLEAEEAINRGADLLIVSDKNLTEGHMPIPDALAIAAIDQHLKHHALRLHASIIAESGQVMNSHHAAVLLAFGASAISPHLVYEQIHHAIVTHPSSYAHTHFAKECSHFHKAMHESIKVTMAKVGFPRVSGYIGACGAVMEAVGLKLSEENSDPYSLSSLFPTVSSGVELYDLEMLEVMAHTVAERDDTLPEHGVHMFKGTGKDRHNFSPRFVEIFREWMDEETIEAYTREHIPPAFSEAKRRLMHTLMQPGQEAAYTARVFAGQVVAEYCVFPHPTVDLIPSPFRERARVRDEGEALSEHIANALTLLQAGTASKEDTQQVSSWLEVSYRAKLPTMRRLNGALLKDGRYDTAFIDGFTPSPAYTRYETAVKREQQTYPVTILDHITIGYGESAIPSGYTEYGRTLALPRKPLPLDEVQPTSAILKSIYSGAMSYGSTGSIAHGDLAEAHYALGSGGTNAGEGGEPTYRYGTVRNGKNKQWATGRFGTGAMMLAAIPGDGFIQIKIAQGAKPGEGGELPAMKVSVEIASNRGGIPGVELISPAPHHDIYSIEDLKALISSHKSAGKQVSVKLAATRGIGTIACGVAKAGADQINIASDSGGTGASKETSVKNTGISGLLGLIEADHALKKEGLRDTVQLITSGSFRSSEDLLKSAIWADGFELGTLSLMQAGCVMIRECGKAPKFDSSGEELLEAGGCSVGVTNTPWLYSGKIEDIERFTLSLAASLRARLAALGFSSLKHIKGHTELLGLMLPSSIHDPYLGNLFKQAENASIPRFDKPQDKRWNSNIINDIKELLKQKHNDITYTSSPITLDTMDHSFGTGLSMALCTILRRSQADRKGYSSRITDLPLAPEQRIVADNAIHIITSGNAGQTYGFVNSHGIHLDHTGRVHDFVGNSMTGGIISISAPESYRDRASDMQIAGNSCLYGASGGKAFFDGGVGDRFAVRNSGVTVVVSGNAGDYACEYMTAGSAVFLGTVGKGFGAGMVSGIAMLYDHGNLEEKLDKRFVAFVSKEAHHRYIPTLKSLLEEHSRLTRSVRSAYLLAHWDKEQHRFRMVMPAALLAIAGDPSRESKIRDIVETYKARETPICPFMEVWVASYATPMIQAQISSRKL